MTIKINEPSVSKVEYDDLQITVIRSGLHNDYKYRKMGIASTRNNKINEFPFMFDNIDMLDFKNNKIPEDEKRIHFKVFDRRLIPGVIHDQMFSLTLEELDKVFEKYNDYTKMTTASKLEEKRKILSLIKEVENKKGLS